MSTSHHFAHPAVSLRSTSPCILTRVRRTGDDDMTSYSWLAAHPTLFASAAHRLSR